MLNLVNSKVTRFIDKCVWSSDELKAKFQMNF